MVTETLKPFKGLSQDEQVALFARMVTGNEPRLIRTTLLRILGKTIADLPDISDAVSDRRAQKESRRSIIRDESDTNDDEPLFDNIADEDEESVEEHYEDQEEIEELRGKTRRFTTRELELCESELSRLEAGKTQKNFTVIPTEPKASHSNLNI